MAAHGAWCTLRKYFLCTQHKQMRAQTNVGMINEPSVMGIYFNRKVIMYWLLYFETKERRNRKIRYVHFVFQCGCQQFVRRLRGNHTRVNKALFHSGDQGMFMLTMRRLVTILHGCLYWMVFKAKKTVLSSLFNEITTIKQNIFKAFGKLSSYFTGYLYRFQLIKGTS